MRDFMDLESVDNGNSGKGLFFVISSVSGGGKTTVIGELLERLGDLRMSVSHTTRKPRKGEVDARDYYFVSVERFDEMSREGLFIEWAKVYGQSYGTSGAEVESITRQGIDALLDIDVQGAMQVKDNNRDAILIFILPPDEKEQERRLRDRGTESVQEIDMRLQAARQELAFTTEYHYSVLNDDLDAAVNALCSIIIAERCRNRGKPLNQ
jgi:guanylate kinase